MPANNPKYIIIHCTAYPDAKLHDQLVACNGWHKDRQFPLSSLNWYVGYHHLITGGRDYKTRDDLEEGAHCNQQLNNLSMNFQSLGVCAGFDGDTEDMSQEHYTLLKSRVFSWQDTYKIPNENVFFHRHFATDKTCPGLRINDQWLKNLLIRPQLPPVSILPTTQPSTCGPEKATIADQANQIAWYVRMVEALKAIISNIK